MKNKKNNKGFTLVELLVVIAIIGILAVVAVPALFKHIEKGKIADLEADISAIRSAALSHYGDTSEFPLTDRAKEGIGTDYIDGYYVRDNQKQEEGVLKGKIEGLSNPFKGDYELVPKRVVTNSDSDDLVLNIINLKGLTKSGLDKLQKDVGNITGDTESIVITIIEP